MTLSVYTPPSLQQNAWGIHCDISVTIDVARTIQTIVVARIILSAFRHYSQKYPKGHCTIGDKHVELEEAKVVGLIDQIRQQEDIQQDIQRTEKTQNVQPDSPTN